MIDIEKMSVKIGELSSEGSDNSINIKKGIVFSRRVVRDKPVYEYSIILDSEPTSFDTLVKLEYSIKQIENIIISKKVEDKVNDFKAEVAEE